MADSTVRVTLVWGEMKLELEGDAAPTLAELQNLRVNGLGRLADFFALRNQAGPAQRDSAAPVAPPVAPFAPPGPPPAPGAISATQFAITRLNLPATAAEAASMALRHGSSGPARGNVVGSALAAVAQVLSLDLSRLAATPAPSIWLAYFAAASASSPQARLTVRGGLPHPNAPGTYAVDPSFTPKVFSGTASVDMFITADSGAPAGPLTVAIGPPLLMGLEIHEAYAELNLTSPTVMGGKLQGLVKADEFLDSLAQALGAYVVVELSSNPGSNTATTLRAMFLSDAASPDEIPTGAQMAGILRRSALIQSMVTSDASLRDGSAASSVALAFVARPFVSWP
jgi:hypothetical protein